MELQRKTVVGKLSHLVEKMKYPSNKTTVELLCLLWRRNLCISILGIWRIQQSEGYSPSQGHLLGTSFKKVIAVLLEASSHTLILGLSLEILSSTVIHDLLLSQPVFPWQWHIPAPYFERSIASKCLRLSYCQHRWFRSSGAVRLTGEELQQRQFLNLEWEFFTSATLDIFQTIPLRIPGSAHLSWACLFWPAYWAV